jgi:serine/threonine protein kinase
MIDFIERKITASPKLEYATIIDIEASSESTSETDISSEKTDPKENKITITYPEYAGTYKRDKLLGAGGFGEVYQYVDDNQHIIAVKNLKIKDSFENTLQEAEHESKYIQRIHGYSEVIADKDSMCIVMPKLKGKSMEEVVDEAKSDLDYLKIAKKSAQQLADLHNKGIIHSDLLDGPNNYLITSNLEFLWLDFGSAREVNEDNQEFMDRDIRGIVGLVIYLIQNKLSPTLKAEVQKIDEKLMENNINLSEIIATFEKLYELEKTKHAAKQLTSSKLGMFPPTSPSTDDIHQMNRLEINVLEAPSL